MSNARAIVWLLIGSIAAVVAYFVVGVYAPEARVQADGRLAAVPADPARLVVSRAGEPATVLERDAEWRIVSPYAARADAQTVLRLVDAVSFAEPEDVISEAELLKLGRERSDFGLETPRLVVMLGGAGDGSDSVSVSFGVDTPSSNGVYAAVEGSGSVCVVPAAVFAAADLSAEAFRARAVFPLGAESVASFDVKRPGEQPLSFERGGSGWKTQEGQAAADKVDAFLTLLSAAEAKSFVWPVGSSNEATSVSASLLSGYGLDPDSAITVSLRCGDGEDRRVSFGAAADDDSVYALVQNGGAVVTVDAALRDAVLQVPAKLSDSRPFPLEASAVTAFAVADGDVTCALAREQDGAWRLESPVAAPADAKAAEALLHRILALSAADAGDGGDAVSVSVGTNSEAVVVSRRRLLGTMRLEDLRSREVIAVDPALVTRLVSSTAGQKPVSVVYSRERTAWSPESAEGNAVADEAAIAKVLAALNPLRASGVVALKASAADLGRYGLDRPALTLAVDRGGEGMVRRNVLVGGKAPDGGRYATVGSADAIFTIPRETMKLLSLSLLRK